ncbi:hypothetical protein AMTRI_Chr02g254400 [Amborella trichopoda]|uniref:Uncharacterized protein n=1 Tax=Amborella trichopoda TaxID=13333 RepID=W1NQL7_AMBTC|nr:hypothetical protein AMTR_s00092p00109460 [Amborella trichopoda]
MEKEMQKMGSISFRAAEFRSLSQADGFSLELDDVEDLKYISLRDIIPLSHGFKPWLETNGFDSSQITIKNQLVKQAASAYLQSTAILAIRERSCMARIWTRVWSRVMAHVVDPVFSCVRYLAERTRWLVTHMTRQIDGLLRVMC